MTSLISRPTGPARPRRTDSRPRPRLPLAVVASAGGVLAALGPLAVCLVLGVVGWFLADAGSHGQPSDGLRVGATAWLMGHGSGVSVEGVRLTVVPLGVTLLAAWSTWRAGLRVGHLVSGHGPDADGIEDGERDWTVPVAVALLTAGYAVTGIVTASLAATRASSPGTGGVVTWSLLLGVLVALPALAIGSGRAAIWVAGAPPSLVESVRTARRVLRTWLVVALAAFLLSFALDLGTAANVMSQLHSGAGDVVIVVLVSLLLLPNAVAFSGAYLAGPGFTVGAGTLVSPSVVVLGPLPMFPMLAALPDAGEPPAWTVALVALPVLVAALAAARAQQVAPTLRWEEGALRGCVGGALAAVAFAILSGLAGGAVGPGRMREVTPLAGDVLVQCLTTFGLGGLLGGLVMTAWQRRAARAGDAH
ncbi:DUF6350 family protein [uncultured Nocardioides sp.]|uniref:cell division protein PerM n=1 Tax=uncultured Nocardioides sp. TaxID=198441 RepID=UPI000C56ADFA|nr:DUF6350 family protein [uncultured Nocardioides sp.]MAO82033.1 hypothetical protein [Nocardioides sp.]